MKRSFLPACWCRRAHCRRWPLHANDRGHGHHGRDRDRAADLADCCTPGDQDFPKVGGNLGNQNYSRCTRSTSGSVRQARRRLGQPHRRRPDHRHQPEHHGGGRRRDLHRVGARQPGGRRRQDRRHQVEVHAHRSAASRAAAWRWPRTWASSTRWPTTTAWSRSTRTPARWCGQAASIDGLRQRREGGAGLPRQAAVHRHQRRQPRRGAVGGRDQRRPAWHRSGACRAPARSATTPGAAHPETSRTGATPWIHPAVDPDLEHGLLDLRQRARRLVAERLARGRARTCSPTRSSRST